MERANLSSLRVQRRQAWRASQRKRTHQHLHDASDYLREIDVDASGMAEIWIGVGLQIAASILEEMAATVLCEDIVEGLDNEQV